MIIKSLHFSCTQSGFLKITICFITKCHSCTKHIMDESDLAVNNLIKGRLLFSNIRFSFIYLCLHSSHYPEAQLIGAWTTGSFIKRFYPFYKHDPEMKPTIARHEPCVPFMTLAIFQGWLFTGYKNCLKRDDILLLWWKGSQPLKLICFM